MHSNPLLTELGVAMNLGAIDPVEAGNEQINTLADFERHVRAIPKACSAPNPIETFYHGSSRRESRSHAPPPTQTPVQAK